MSQPKQKALFLDRDGVINVDINYLHRIEDVEFIDGIFDLCRRAHAAGYILIVVTNQAGIGRGLCTEGDFHTLMEWMRARFAEAGCPLTAVYFCPHHPTEAKGDYLQVCDCRKPKPGMLLQAMQEHNIDMSTSVLLGDKESDIQAGNAAGVGMAICLNPHRAPETFSALIF